MTTTLTRPDTGQQQDRIPPESGFQFSYFGWDATRSMRAGGEFDPFVDTGHPRHHARVVDDGPYHRRFYVQHPGLKMGSVPIGEKDFDKNPDRYLHFDGHDNTHLLMHMGKSTTTERSDGMGNDCHRIIEVWLITATPGTTRDQIIDLAKRPRNDDEDVITGDIVIDDTSPIVDIGAITLAG